MRSQASPRNPADRPQEGVDGFKTCSTMIGTGQCSVCLVRMRSGRRYNRLKKADGARGPQKLGQNEPASTADRLAWAARARGVKLAGRVIGGAPRELPKDDAPTLASLGEMLAKTERHPTGPKTEVRYPPGTELPPKLSELGLTKKESARAQMFAEAQEKAAALAGGKG